MTLVAENHVPDEVYDEVRKQFTEEELANLTFALIAINGANRLNIAFRTIPGSHQVTSSRRVVRGGDFAGKSPGSSMSLIGTGRNPIADDGV